MAADLPHAIVLDLRNDLAELGRVATVLAAFGDAAGLPPRTVFDLTLAIDEIVTNVISYAFPDGAEHRIAVRVARAGDVVTVEIEDDGRPFDPRAVPPAAVDRPLGERPIGGLGIHLVRHAVDSMHYQRCGGHNILCLTKRAGGGSW